MENFILENISNICKQEKIGNGFCPLTCGDYLIFYGNMLYVFKKDGTLVVRRKDLRNIQKVVMITKDQLLVACGSEDAYIAISLQDGRECWRIFYPKCDILSKHFVKSPDGLQIYDYYDWRGDYYFAKIDLESKNIETFRLKNGFRCIRDIICDEEGYPYLLENHYEQVAEKNVSTNGVRHIYGNELNPSSSYFWKHKWEMDHPRIASCFLNNADTVLTNDLYVYNLKEDTSYYLLENEENWEKPAFPLYCCWADLDNNYIVLVYQNINVIVDKKERKMAARYKATYQAGCFVGDEYWICTDQGVKRKPFPQIEDVPLKKPTFLV